MDGSRIWVFVMWYNKTTIDYINFSSSVLLEFPPEKYMVVLVMDNNSFKQLGFRSVIDQGWTKLETTSWSRDRQVILTDEQFQYVKMLNHFIFISYNKLAEGIGYKRWLALEYAKQHNIRYICLLDDNVAELRRGSANQMPRQFTQRVSMNVLPEEALRLWQQPEYGGAVVFGCSSYCDHVLTGGDVANTWALNKYIIIDVERILMLETEYNYTIEYDPELELFGEDIDFFIKLHPDPLDTTSELFTYKIKTLMARKSNPSDCGPATDHVSPSKVLHGWEPYMAMLGRISDYLILDLVHFDTYRDTNICDSECIPHVVPSKLSIKIRRVARDMYTANKDDVRMFCKQKIRGRRGKDLYSFNPCFVGGSTKYAMLWMHALARYLDELCGQRSVSIEKYFCL